MPSQDFLATIKLALAGKEQVVSGLKEAQAAAQKLASTKVITTFDAQGVATGKQLIEVFKPVSAEVKKSSEGMNDFVAAMRRAVIVAPVWMAIRGAMQLVQDTLQEGARTWLQYEQAMSRAEQTLGGVAVSATAQLTDIREEFKKFSAETGFAIEKLALSYNLFLKTGASAGDAFTGVIASGKLAETTFGDNVKVTEAFSVIMRQLGGTIDSSLSPMEKQEALAGKILALYDKNKFSIEEYMDALSRFSSTAKFANFTADQTISVLAALESAGMKSSLGASTLRTAIQKLAENMDKVSPRLGIALAGKSQFEDFLAILRRINELSKTTGQEGLAGVLKELGVGGKTGQGIVALNSVFEQLVSNLKLVGGEGGSYIKLLNDRMLEVDKQANHQVEVFNNLRILLGAAFVEGVGGGKDFAESMKNINNVMNMLIPAAQNVGMAIHAIFTPGVGSGTGLISPILKYIELSRQKEADKLKVTQDQISLAYKGQLDATQRQLLVQKITTDYTNETLQGRQAILDVLIKTLPELEQKKIAEKQAVELADEERSKKTEALRQELQLKVATQDKLAVMREELEIMKLQASGASGVEIATKKLDNIVSVLVNRYNSLTINGKKLTETLSASGVESQILSGNLGEIDDMFKGMKLTEQEQVAIAKAYNDIMKERSNMTKTLLSHEMDLYKIRGVSNSVLLQAEIALKTQLYGVNAVKKDLQLQLDIEKQITREKMNQVDISSETVKLYDIAQTYGLNIAKEIGRYQTGEIDFFRLKQMPRVFEVFQKEYADEYKKIQAMQYFGLPIGATERYGFGGRRVPYASGVEVPIPEYNLPKDMTDLISRTRAGALSELKEININGLTIEVTQEVKQIIESGVLAQKTLSVIANAMINDPKIKKDFQEKLMKPY